MLDPLHDPLKGKAVVPQKYVEMMERQGWVKPIRCKDCKNWERDWEPSGNHRGRHWCPNIECFPEPDFFCADGERPDAPTCGPDYCEIGGVDDAR